MNCYQRCQHLDKDLHRCRLTGKPLTYVPNPWGTIYSHQGYCGHENGGKGFVAPRN